ncbi:sensor histidine kinase [Gudongella sp. DL1XJH-153]|uniref:sensor histidine kinase n=1 Tax=Gudongella sp. DL1XJH-153 TaxID=3409804 RepID=UPI003BB52A4F
MRESIHTKSLNFKLWTYFMIFAAIIMILLWLLQIVFINSYYETMKINEIRKIGNELVSIYGTEDFEQQLLEKSFSEGIVINILDQNGSVVYPLDIMDLVRRPRLQSAAFSEFLNKLYITEENFTVYTRSHESLDAETIVYGAILQNENSPNYFLFINTMLEPIDSTVNVLKNQLVIITIISLILSMGLSLFLSRKLSRPITRLTTSAKGLGEGRYDIEFKKGDYLEVDNLADTLNQATSELKKSEELRRDFIANVTHDLKTPLTLIKSYGEMVRDISGDNPEKREAHLNTIIQETDRLSRLVDDMLDLTKVQSELREMKVEKFDILEETNSVLERFSYFREQEGFQISVEAHGDTNIHGDRLKISQAIYNLINNSINYSLLDKKIIINVDGQESRVKFSIKDFGQGILEEEKDYIWDRYYRGGKSHTRKKAGSGIGLSLVKSIVQAHNGQVGVESKAGEGSLFWFILPRNMNE